MQYNPTNKVAIAKGPKIISTPATQAGADEKAKSLKASEPGQKTNKPKKP